MFLTKRFDKQRRLYEDNEKEYKKETQKWLRELTKDYPRLKNYVPRAESVILNLVKLQKEVNEIDDSQEIDEIIDVFEEYCRNWLFLE